MKPTRTLSWFVFLCLAVGLPVGGCKKTEIKNPADLAPTKDLFTPEDLDKNFVKLNVRPFLRDDLAFSIAVPNDWRDTRLKVDPQVADNPQLQFVPLTRQLAPEGTEGNPTIEVNYMVLELEASLEDWVLAYIEAAKLNVLFRQPGVFGERLVEDLVVKTVQGKEDYLARMTFSRDGNRVFLVVGSASASVFPEYVKIFGVAAINFMLKQKSENTFVEQMKSFVSPGPPFVEFRHPESWVTKEMEGTPAGRVEVDVVFRTVDKILALIHVKGELKDAANDAAVIIRKIKMGFESAGVTIGPRLRVKDLDPDQTPPLAKIEIWNAAASGNDAEVVTLVMENEKAFYALGMLIPKREGNPISWMSAWRAFEIIAADLRKSAQRPVPALP